MKKILLLALIALFSVQHTDAQKARSKKKHTINVKMNVSPKRGKLYLKVYPHAQEGEEGRKDCKTIKQNLPRKGSKRITIPARCCWRELKIAEIGKDKKKRVLGRITSQEPVCMYPRTTLDISEGKKEKGMARRPLEIKAEVSKEKKKAKKK